MVPHARICGLIALTPAGRPFTQALARDLAQEEELTLEDARHQIQRLNEEYGALDERYKAEKSFSRKVMAVMAFLIVVLLLVCINLLIARGRRGNRWEDIAASSRKKKCLKEHRKRF